MGQLIAIFSASSPSWRDARHLPGRQRPPRPGAAELRAVRHPRRRRHRRRRRASIANSGGWFLGGPAVAPRRRGRRRPGRRPRWAPPPPPPERRWRIPDKLRAGVFLGPGAAVPVRRAGRSRRPHDLPELPQPSGRGARGLQNYRDSSATRRSSASTTSTTSSRAACSSPAWSSRSVALVLVLVRGVGSRRGVDLSAPTPVISLDDGRHPRHAGGDGRPRGRHLEQRVLGGLRHRPGDDPRPRHRGAGRPLRGASRWPSR